MSGFYLYTYLSIYLPIYLYISRKTLRLLQAEFPEFVNPITMFVKGFTSLEIYVLAMPQDVHETASVKWSNVIQAKLLKSVNCQNIRVRWLWAIAPNLDILHNRIMRYKYLN